MGKIFSAHGIRGIFKGQVPTLYREASGYGVYFLVYEKLVQREIAQRGIKREEISATNAVLYGATAGYAVRHPAPSTSLAPLPQILHHVHIGVCGCACATCELIHSVCFRARAAVGDHLPD